MYGMFRLLFLKIAFFLLAHFFYVPVFLVGALLPKKARKNLWRWTSAELIRTSFFLAGIKLHVKNRPKEIDRHVIYAANHPTLFDGLLLHALLGPSVTPVTAPLSQFPWIVSAWLRHVGVIDILRDDIDKARYKGSNTKREALEKALAALKREESIIIFPEGHTEKIEALYYLHTGAARLSLASGIPIQPIIIKDAHIVFSNRFGGNKRTITFEFGDRIFPEGQYGEEILFTKNQALRQKVRDLTAHLETEILRSLPLRQRYEQRKASNSTAVFVDIDMTLYDGLSQVDFLFHLMRTRCISMRSGIAIVGLFVLERAGLMTHEEMMHRVIRSLAGWNQQTVNRIICRFFRSIALPKLQYGLFSLLEDHLAKGHKIVFVSEAIHPLAKCFADFFEADGAIDTSLRKRGRRYTGEIQMLCRGENKARGVTEYAQEHNIDLRKSYAYADSFTDLPMLQLVGHPIAVHPDRLLKRFASLHSMRVLKHVS